MSNVDVSTGTLGFYVFRPVHGQGCLSLDHNEARLGGVARSAVEVE